MKCWACEGNARWRIDAGTHVALTCGEHLTLTLREMVRNGARRATLEVLGEPEAIEPGQPADPNPTPPTIEARIAYIRQRLRKLNAAVLTSDHRERLRARYTERLRKLEDWAEAHAQGLDDVPGASGRKLL